MVFETLYLVETEPRPPDLLNIKGMHQPKQRQKLEVTFLNIIYI